MKLPLIPHMQNPGMRHTNSRLQKLKNSWVLPLGSHWLLLLSIPCGFGMQLKVTSSMRLGTALGLRRCPKVSSCFRASIGEDG